MWPWWSPDEVTAEKVSSEEFCVRYTELQLSMTNTPLLFDALKILRCLLP